MKADRREETLNLNKCLLSFYLEKNEKIFQK